MTGIECLCWWIASTSPRSEAMRYAHGLHADELAAVHFVLDTVHAARLQERWQEFGHTTELQLVGCLDRNVGRAAQGLVLQAKSDHPDATVTVLLPRRSYSALLGRLLHDRTADKIARVVSRIPGASAQIVAYDISSRITQAQADRASAATVSDGLLSVMEETPAGNAGDVTAEVAGLPA
jgi:hypothetical protein